MSHSISNLGFGSRSKSTGREADRKNAQATTGGRRFRLPPAAKIAIGVGVGLTAGILMMKVHAQQLEVLAVINGKIITQSELDRQLENASGQMAMRQIATQELQLQFAKKSGSLPSEAWMDSKMAELRKNANFGQTLARLGQTEDDYRQNLQIHVAQAALLSRGLKITDADVRQFYQTNVSPQNPSAAFYQPESADISVVVASSADSAAKAATALGIGTPFSEVAAKYSVDSSRMNGGSLPAILRGRTNSARIPGLENYIFSMRVGQTSQPLKFGSTYWIIRCLNRTPMKTLSFDQVKEDCEIGAQMAKGAAANGPRVQAEFESFQRTSKIQAFSLKYEDAIHAH